eukprot:COSAG02_NODE_26733_length_626_cov_0.664137_1_plen_195_part_10
MNHYRYGSPENQIHGPGFWINHTGLQPGKAKGGKHRRPAGQQCSRPVRSSACVTEQALREGERYGSTPCTSCFSGVDCFTEACERWRRPVARGLAALHTTFVGKIRCVCQSVRRSVGCCSPCPSLHSPRSLCRGCCHLAHAARRIVLHIQAQAQFWKQRCAKETKLCVGNRDSLYPSLAQDRQSTKMERVTQLEA